MTQADGTDSDPTQQLSRQLPIARRVGSWLVWWVLLMSFWTYMDDTLRLAELLVGAAAAALAATLAELVSFQTATHFRMRIEWLPKALPLPWRVLRDTVVVFRALWEQLAHGVEPSSRFRELPARFGDDSPEGITRRVLLLGGSSVAPNSFALGIDREREVMVVHELVSGES